jgi:hypothetical protein
MTDEQWTISDIAQQYTRLWDAFQPADAPSLAALTVGLTKFGLTAAQLFHAKGVRVASVRARVNPYLSTGRDRFVLQLWTSEHNNILLLVQADANSDKFFVDQLRCSRKQVSQWCWLWSALAVEKDVLHGL